MVMQLKGVRLMKLGDDQLYQQLLKLLIKQKMKMRLRLLKLKMVNQMQSTESPSEEAIDDDTPGSTSY